MPNSSSPLLSTNKIDKNVKETDRGMLAPNKHKNSASFLNIWYLRWKTPSNGRRPLMEYDLKILIVESQSNLRSYQKFKLRCPTQTLLGFTTGKFIGIPRVKLECCPTNPAC